MKYNVKYYWFWWDILFAGRFHREKKDGDVVYDVIPETVNIQATTLQLGLGRRGRANVLSVEISFLVDNILRMKIKPTGSARQRYEIPVGDVLVSEPMLQRYTVVLMFVILPITSRLSAVTSELAEVGQGDLVT